MTWSIIARDPRTGEIAIAVATKFFAVGARVPFLRAGVGALATQALVNPLYGRRGLALLEADVPAADVVRLRGSVPVEYSLARQGAEVVGLDQSLDMLAGARERQARLRPQPGSVELVHGQAERLPFPDASFDALTFTYLLRYVDDPLATLSELARVVKPGGTIGMVEFGVPGSAVLRGLWRVHTRWGLPLLGRAVSSAWFEVGRFLGPNIEEFHAQHPDLEALWRRAGIQAVQTRRMSFGAGLVMWGAKA